MPAQSSKKPLPVTTRTFRNGTCLDCGCADHECECELPKEKRSSKPGMTAEGLTGWKLRMTNESLGYSIELGVGSNAGRFLVFRDRGIYANRERNLIVASTKRLSGAVRAVRRHASKDRG